MVFVYGRRYILEVYYRGVKKRENIEWSENISYAVGLIATDGSLSKDGRHIDLTSKDKEQLENFKKCLNLGVKVGSKGKSVEKMCYRVQFGNVSLYDFFMEIGLTPAKTKTIGALKIPDEYFFDFLRGSYDGDGCFYSYWDKRFKSSYMFYLCFASASRSHINWMRNEINKHLGILGYVKTSKNSCVIELRYAKSDSLRLLERIYHSDHVICLSRKRLKIERALSIIGRSLKMREC